MVEWNIVLRDFVEIFEGKVKWEDLIEQMLFNSFTLTHSPYLWVVRSQRNVCIGKVCIKVSAIRENAMRRWDCLENCVLFFYTVCRYLHISNEKKKKNI